MSEIKYSTVSFTTSWLPGSIGFTEQAKVALADQLNLDKRIIRGSYAILGASKDPFIKEGTALKRILSVIRDEYTIPEYTITTAAKIINEGKSTKIKGSYLIENIQIDKFLTRFHEARMAYLRWGQRLMEPETFNRIMEADKQALGKDWELIKEKYPTAEQMADAIQCDHPRIIPYDATFNIDDVAPETAKYLKNQAQARLDASIDGTVSEFITELKQLIVSVAKNCGKRIRIMPVDGSKYVQYRNAEVQTISTHEDDTDIPEEQLVLTLQPAVKAESGKLVQSGKTQDICVSKDDYVNLMRPYETEESKQLSTSGFEHLMFLTNKINQVKSMLDMPDSNLIDTVDAIQDTLTSFGKSAADITDNIKSSNYTRRSAQKIFMELHEKILTTEVAVKENRKTPRRKIS